MRLARSIALDLIGAGIILGTLLSVIRSTILPRGVKSLITGIVFRATRIVFRLRTGRSPSYERRDRVMAMYGPITLLLLLSSWYTLLTAGYTALYLGVGVNRLGQAFRLSGSTIITLGTTTDSRLVPSVLTFTEAGLGLLVLTLLITYLPTLYGVFAQREGAVAQLQVRAGTPPTAWTLLIRYYRIGLTDRLTELWQQWEGWFAALEESHTSFPILVFFRSPQPDQSWITAAGTVLDAASIWASTVEHPNDPDVQLCIRAGFVALRRLADFFNVAHDPDPGADDAVTISRAEYDEACRLLGEAGLPLRADREAAWQSFKGWRVNYDTVLLNLARMVEAPIAPWTSDRSPVSRQHQWTLRRSISLRRPTGSRRLPRRERRT
ncbi:MAG: hypothetical protein QOF20_2717 [Acidimicrobiaceae bacterium]|jgi:hypothetical protein|nr:hypothetical protein [Acidimicrobiaceae bacterium]MDQ1367068.1 hypothetical protein [Acidimicrobiaceae bacterium]MDQ1370364.1 hypothetical protein [Acidimicrobiaceae bacterium]MDQ1376192.1 hypothetical protein [Acidimicrobiaceae bacterium]MDQ1399269.1 hypothetical protein [Acidimicrobiaceae bacterium]